VQSLRILPAVTITTTVELVQRIKPLNTIIIMLSPFNSKRNRDIPIHMIDLSLLPNPAHDLNPEQAAIFRKHIFDLSDDLYTAQIKERVMYGLFFAVLALLIWLDHKTSTSILYYVLKVLLYLTLAGTSLGAYIRFNSRVLRERRYFEAVLGTAYRKPTIL
jgi:hypothetical protein